MLIIKNDGNKSIERMLKEYKRKVDKTKLLKELRERQQYNKPSHNKRRKRQIAIYKQNLKNNDNL